MEKRLYENFKGFSVNDIFHTMCNLVDNGIELKENIAQKNGEVETMTNNDVPQQPLNQILYGPPGTGKTYNTVVKAMNIIGLKNIFRNWYKNNPNYTDKKDALRLYVKEFEKMSKYIGLDICTLFKLKDYEDIQKILTETYVEEYKEQHPRTDRPYCESALKIYGEFLKEFLDLDEKKKHENLKQGFNSLLGSRIEFITFHQSYSYEEFVEGIKPYIPKEVWKAEDIDKIKLPEVKYIGKKGIFREICNRAEKDKENNYVLVIDEINRGNISKIFGELITLIEEDKRENVTGDTSKEYNTIKVTLPYSGNTFSVPNNLYIIGTMNTADRSIALLDTALRRRFDFEEMLPNPGLLNDYEYELDIDVAEKYGNFKEEVEKAKEQNANKVKVTINLKEFLEKLNKNICSENIGHLDKDHKIGHAFLINVNKDYELKRVFLNKIYPLLEEYFYNDTETIKNVLKCSEEKLNNISDGYNWLEIMKGLAESSN